MDSVIGVQPTSSARQVKFAVLSMWIMAAIIILSVSILLN